MLKRSLFAVTLAASTLLVTGIGLGADIGTAQASGSGVCTSAWQAAPVSAPPGQCTWRGDCYYYCCYRTGSWEQQHCDSGSDG
ncbi:MULTISPECIES: hypothetical protein [unclassified Streptosporangium]|uniref:hypothetical protein n=1 Tax=unclassified Streptosporangium TaxID=2632669 RepID=UPI002E2A16AB|nr:MULTISPECIES: hypothetical protein [unclassified Streptosporangium]